MLSSLGERSPNYPPPSVAVPILVIATSGLRNPTVRCSIPLQCKQKCVKGFCFGSLESILIAEIPVQHGTNLSVTTLRHADPADVQQHKEEHDMFEITWLKKPCDCAMTVNLREKVCSQQLSSSRSSRR